MLRRGGDWSGRPGHRCEVCNRSSSDVGPRRGFDYANDVCGGCCEISSDDDGHNEEGHCRSCKKYMYMKGGPNCVPVSGLDNYCMNCVKYCQLCGYRNDGSYDHHADHDIRPKDAEKYKVPLDAAVVDIIDKCESVVAVLGEDAYDGEDVYLCKKCHNNKWKKHPKRGQPFAGYTKEQIEFEFGIGGTLPTKS